MQAQEQKSFDIHFSMLQENGTLARKVQVVPGKNKEDAVDTMKKSLEVEKVDMRKINIYKVELSASKLAGEKSETVLESKSQPPVKKNTFGFGSEKSEPGSSKQPETKKAEAEKFVPRKPELAETPNSFANRVMSFICDVKQNVITNKDGVRTLKLVLEISGTQVNGVQGGMLKYRPQESLKITCEPIQVDMLDDKTKKPERQMTLDDATRTRKQEEKKEQEAKQAKDKKPDGKAKPEDKPAQPETVTLPGTALSQGVDSKGNQYFFERTTRQMYAVTKTGVVSKVDGPPEPLTQRSGGYKGQ